MKKRLQKMDMGELRQLGYDLEPLVGREIRSVRKSELADEVAKALEDIKADEPDAYASIMADLEEGKTEDPPEADATLPESDETTDADAEEGETEEADSGDEKPADEPAALPYAIQLRERNLPQYTYGEIVINPTAEMVATKIHAKLTREGVKRLQARGTRVRKL